MTEDDLKRIFDGEEFIDFIKNQSLYFDPTSSGKDFNLPFLNADHLKLNTDYPEKMEIKYSIFSDDPLISQVIIAILFIIQKESDYHIIFTFDDMQSLIEGINYFNEHVHETPILIREYALDSYVPEIREKREICLSDEIVKGKVLLLPEVVCLGLILDSADDKNFWLNQLFIIAWLLDTDSTREKGSIYFHQKPSFFEEINEEKSGLILKKDNKDIYILNWKENFAVFSSKQYSISYFNYSESTFNVIFESKTFTDAISKFYDIVKYGTHL